MTLAPEIALLAAGFALLLTLLNCLYLISARRGFSAQLAELRTEMDANLSASHNLARHVRNLQKNSLHNANKRKAAKQRAANQKSGGSIEDEYRNNSGLNRAVKREQLEEPVETNTMSLAEKLGLSQSEAEIITHLGPRRKMKQRVRESV